MNALIAKLETRQFLLITGGLLALVLATSASFLILPQWNKYRGAVTERGNLPAVPADSAALEAELETMRSMLNQKSKSLHGDMANLPLREVEAYVIDRLQGIAWNHEVALQGVKPGSGGNVNGFREILFKLDLEGRYFDLFAWLQDLRLELGFVVIKEYRMTGVDDKNDDPLLRVEMTVASYRKDPQ